MPSRDVVHVLVFRCLPGIFQSLWALISMDYYPILRDNILAKSVADIWIPWVKLYPKYLRLYISLEAFVVMQKWP